MSTEVCKYTEAGWGRPSKTQIRIPRKGIRLAAESTLQKKPDLKLSGPAIPILIIQPSSKINNSFDTLGEKPPVKQHELEKGVLQFNFSSKP
jgi:hypothetical protein